MTDKMVILKSSGMMKARVGTKILSAEIAKLLGMIVIHVYTNEVTWPIFKTQLPNFKAPIIKLQSNL